MKNSPASIDEIFFEALRLTSDVERETFLLQACADDAVLRDRIEQLLKAYPKAESFLEAPAMTAAAKIGQPFHSFVGTSIGPYKLRERIGEGGMGEVYVAEQTEPLRRKVALKVIKPGMASRDVVARFGAERQALAMMDHPNIASVLDGGATEAGQPFFVMELVRGVPISEYCDRERLSTTDRLHLFLKVCRAVQHAHQKGIIHRDIKPTNVLVPEIDGEAVPKVIDFGVAKAVSQKLTDQTVYTHLEQVVGTPLYMSPEQAGTGVVDIDTRSDVYSLGVLLYELLTGNTPFDREILKESGFEEFRRALREDEPPKPSDRLSTLAAEALSTISGKRSHDPRRLEQSLKGELDWIVMKALEKDRTRRYETANGLARDIERYLIAEPVEACPPSVGYRMRKFAQRNRTQIAAGSLLTLAILIIAGVSVGFVLDKQAREEQIFREAAHIEQTAVQSVETSLTSARTAIKAGNIELASKAIGEGQGHLATVREDHPELVGQLQSLDDEIQDRREDSERFTTFMEQVRVAERKIVRNDDAGNNEFQDLAIEALAHYSVLSDENWVDPLKNSHLSTQEQTTVRDTVYETLLLLGDNGIRWAKSNKQEQAQAGLEYLQRAEAFHEPTRAFFWVRSECNKVLKNKQATEQDLTLFKQTEAKTAFDHFLPGHTAGWRGDLDEAIRSYEAALRIQPDHHNSLFFLAMRLSKLGRKAEAAQVYRACLALRPNDASALSNRAGLLQDLGFHDDAIDLCNKAIKIESEKANGNSARLFGIRGAIYLSLGQLKKALADLDEAARIATLDDSTNDATTISIYDHRAEVFRLMGQNDKALDDLNAAVKLASGKRHNGSFHVFANRARTLSTMGQNDLALADIDEALRIAANPKLKVSADHIAGAHTERGRVLVYTQRNEEALTECDKALALASKSNKNVAIVVACIRATALKDLGRFKESVIELNKVIEQKTNPNREWALSSLAWLLVTCPDPTVHDVPRALELASQAVKSDPTNGGFFNTLGVAQYRNENWMSAITTLEKSLELSDTDRGGNRFFLAMAKWQLGKSEEARRWYREAVVEMQRVPPEDEDDTKFLKRVFAEATETLGIEADR